MKKSNYFIIFDFCLTLVDCNTTNELIKYVFKKSSFFRKLWILFVVFISRSINLIDKKNRYNESVLTLCFTFLTVKNFNLICNNFVDDVLLDKINNSVFNIFKSKSYSNNLIICTNTFESIVARLLIVKKVNAKCVGSRLCDNGYFITFGYHTHVLKYGKVNTLASRYLQFEVIQFWTDDLYADSDLVSISNETIHVLGDKYEVL